MANDKHMNREGDVVLVHYQDRPAFYARIEAIEPDTVKGWYHVSLLLLTMPAQTVTWILREEYINGVTFTMGGQSLRLEMVERVCVEEKSGDDERSSGKQGGNRTGKVIPLKKKS